MGKTRISLTLLSFFLLFSSLVIAQKTISGIITSEEGETLPGVSILYKGNTTRTVTNSVGFYKIDVQNEKAVLVFSYLGFQTENTLVGNRSIINLTLKPDMKAIDEIIVVGYGEQKKVNLTGSVSNVRIDEKLASRSIDNNLATALSGMVPGLSIRQGSGMPGNSNTEMLIRGLGTVNNANPLIVVDGMPDIDINSININDVESVSVLKDAASSAVYGSRAANGVILITTKSGKNSKPTIKYSGSTTTTQPIKFYENLDNYPRSMLLQIRGANAGNKATVYKWGAIEEWMAKGMLDPILYPNTDWYDIIFKDGSAVNHNVSASGSTDKMNFFISAGLTDQTGVVINNFYKRYNFRSNLEYEIRKNVKVGTKIDAKWSETRYGDGDGIAGDGIRNTNPGVTPIDPVTGRYGGAMAYGENTQASNLLANYSINHNEKISRGVNGNLYGIWEPLKGLTARVDYGLTYVNQFSRSWSDPTNTYNLQTGQIVTIMTSDNAGISNGMSIDYKTNLQFRLDYKKELFKNHKLGAMIAYTEEYWEERDLSGSRMDRLYPNILEISAALPTTQKISGSSSSEGLKAYIGRFNYDILDRYLFEATFRYDGSSKFSKGNEYGFFPSVSTGWRFSEERFFENLKSTINYGKLRFSWGALGNNSGVDRYEQKETFETTNYNFNNAVVKGFSYSKMIDPKFSWESTQVMNGGIEFGLFNNLLFAEIDYYDRLTTGMIRPSNLSSFLFGYYPPRVNVGNLRNRGVETTITLNKKVGNWVFGAKSNFSYNVNNLEKWNEYLSPGDVYLNMPYNYIYMYQDKGIAQSWNEVYNNAFQANYASPGDILVTDINGDGRISSDDRQAFPDKMQQRPTFNTSLSLNASWKGIDLSAFMNGTAGRFDYWQDNLTTTSPRDNRFNYSAFHWNDTWDYYNRDATMNRLTISTGDDGGKNGGSSTYFLQDRSYLRLKNVQLGYSIPTRLLRTLGISKLRCYFSADNLITFTKWQGIDPEKDTDSADFYPLLKSYAFGVNIDF